MLRKIVFLAPFIFTCQFQICGQDNGFKLKSTGDEIVVCKFSRYYYVSVELQKPASFELLSPINITSAEISPLNEEIPFTFDRKEIRFTISKAGYSLIRINDTLKVFLFAEKPESAFSEEFIDIVKIYGVDNTGQTCETAKIQKALDDISGSGKLLYFPQGVYKSGQLFPRSNSKIRLARGAILNSDTSSIKPYFPTDNIENRRFIYMNGVENIEITGSGIINGNGRYLRSKYGDDARVRLILAVRSKNILVEGLTLKDPGSWNTQVIQCNGVILRNIKLFNDIDLSNTDGFDPDASSNVLIENCFAYCGDDNVAVKVTGKKDLVSDVNNITVRGCVFLTRKSALKVGTETRTGSMKNISFINNDILECDRGMALYVHDGATLDSISFINNRFERNHPDAQKKAIHFDVDRRNPESKLGTIKHVLIKNCSFLKSFPNKSVIEYNGETNGINVTIKNLKINGKKVKTLEEARIDAVNSTINFQ